MKPRILQTPVIVIAALSLALSPAAIRSADAPQVSANNSAGLQVPALKPANTVWMSREATEVLKLVRADVTDEVVMAFIEHSRTGFSLTADEIVQLHNEGVSDKLIGAMLARRKQPPQPIIAARPQPAEQEAPQQQIVQQPATVVTQPSVTYVQSQPVYAPAPTTYVYSSPSYDYYNPYPYYYSSYWYPRVSFNFGFRNGFYGGHYGYGHYAPSHSYGGYHGGYHGGFHGGHRR